MSLPGPAAHRRRAARIATVVFSFVALLVGIQVISAGIEGVRLTPFLDIDTYLGFTRSWLDGHGFYKPEQLTGAPYVIEDVFGNTYPPTILYLLVPFALGLPVILWWLIPGAVLLAALVRSRPVWWAIPLLPLLLCFTRPWIAVAVGNPSMWAAAFAVAGVVWGWPAVGAALKLTFLPFALVGVPRRSWWFAAIVAVVAALPFGGLWGQYLVAVLNARSNRGTDYVLGELPMVTMLVLVAMSRGIDEWLTRRRSRPEAVSGERPESGAAPAPSR